MPSFSIITPVFNREDCLLRCMESVRIQNKIIDFEHIIVDDGSTDSTVAILSEYAKKNPYVHAFFHEKNKGTNAARNLAISQANKEWCIILDSDDYFVPDALQQISEFMEKCPGYNHYLFAASDMISFYKKNKLTALNKAELTFCDWLKGNISGDFIHVLNTSIARRHPFNEPLRIRESLTFLEIFKEATPQLFTRHIITIRDRMRLDSVTNESCLYRKGAMRMHLDFLNFFLQKFSEDFVSEHVQHRYIFLLRQKRLFSLLLGDRHSFKEAESDLCFLGIKTSFFLKGFIFCRIGVFLKPLVCFYSRIKNK